MVAERWTTRSEPEYATARDVAVSNLAAREHGVLSVEQLRACGLDHDAIAVRRDNGHLHWLHKGVYAVGHAKVTLEGCYLAAVKACSDGAVLCRWSAAIVME